VPTPRFRTENIEKLSITLRTPAATDRTTQTQPAYTFTTAKMKTQWKDIPVVPTSQEFLDIVLSRTYVCTANRYMRGANNRQSEAPAHTDSRRFPDQSYSSFLVSIVVCPTKRLI
jgi:hypothetical protein